MSDGSLSLDWPFLTDPSSTHWRAARRWCVRTVASPEELARALTRHTWPPCAGFTVEAFEQYVFLNESCPSSAREDWAVVKLPRTSWSSPAVIDSVTFENRSLEEALAYIREILAGVDSHPIATLADLRLDTPDQHVRCPFCEQQPATP